MLILNSASSYGTQSVCCDQGRELLLLDLVAIHSPGRFNKTLHAVQRSFSENIIQYGVNYGTTMHFKNQLGLAFLKENEVVRYTNVKKLIFSNFKNY